MFSYKPNLLINRVKQTNFYIRIQLKMGRKLNISLILQDYCYNEAIYLILFVLQDDEFLSSTKMSLRQLERLFALKLEHKQSIRNGVACIMGLEHVSLPIKHFVKSLI